MKITWQRSQHEFIHASSLKSPITLDWPEHVPVPTVGDELIYDGATVTVVDRLYLDGSIDHPEDLRLVLVWRDRRVEPPAVIRDSALPPGGKPPLFDPHQSYKKVAKW
jgi:hypothetical protein